MEDMLTNIQKIISYLSFGLGKEHFALNVGRVVNILEMQTITKVPKIPDYVTGIINLRGEVLPVIDTNIKLGFGKTEFTGSTCILVIETYVSGATIKFGILVDTVQEVLEIEDKYILPSPSIGDKFEHELISGVVEQDDRFIMIIDINELLDFNEVLVLDKIRGEKQNQKD